MTFQKLVIGASMAIGVSALATAPAHATSFNFNNTGEINTYTGGSNGTFIKGNAQGGTNAAIKALTDNNPSSNVELWYSSETPGSNVGFTATKGNYSATVSSVNANDWNSFGSQWLGDLLSSYTPFQSVWNGFSADSKSLITSYFPSLGMGDPNIGGFQFGQNGGVELKLVGHLDVKTKLATTISTKVDEKWNAIKSQFPQQTTAPTLSQVESLIPQLQTQLSVISGQITTLQTQLNAIPGQITTLQTQLNAIPNIPANQVKRQQLTSQISQLNTLKNQLPGQISQLNTLKNQLPGQISQLTSFKDVLTLQAALNGYQGEIAASEIAKVVTGGQTYYAYSFNPTASGITASDDGVSYSAIYTWSTPKYVSPSSVPEPSVVFGILGVAGIFVTQRKLKKVSG
ncbi:NF038130 family PEP-CTERM protein [Nostoc cf. edaphicum LEGE 07299]|uniref:NF038130 family PEP-CTERM protein n=1 Tax=Nostoc cf. edaphicum LEGE 07299 TaxID=2777974 RepID=A0ABR9U2G4_9NOSO|nr:NF038130 family PEP-CTERM protein [Nostoc edaphicum]MBE9106050.1 NF038130 family PEP-CTERM protein [Nostoc cf. edaphicum LEGE 07299]